MYDRILILSEVCLDVFEDDSCIIPKDISKPHIDGRGERYREEFMKEVHDAIAVQV
jgi:hypothetical protein